MLYSFFASNRFMWTAALRLACRPAVVVVADSKVGLGGSNFTQQKRQQRIIKAFEFTTSI